MKEISLHELKLLRHRFCEDVGAPIQVLVDPYFTQRINLFEKEYNTLTDYKEYVKYVEKEFDNDVQKYLEFYHSLRDKIIGEVSNSQAFKDFQTDEKITKEIKAYTPVIKNTNLYTQEQVKEGSNCFFSIDMKKANFQALKYANSAIVYDCDTYEDFIGRFTDMPWAKKSKRTREIIFGKLNPNRTMKYENLIIGDIEKHITPIVKDWFDLFSINSDELIYKLKPGLDLNAVCHKLNGILSEETLFNMTGIHLRTEFFKLVCYNFKTFGSDKIMNVFVKEHITGKKTYKCANEIYFPQTYKLINGLEITDDDLVFYYDKSEPAKFFHPLEMIKN
jgi:hypothetical protein